MSPIENNRDEKTALWMPDEDDIVVPSWRGFSTSPQMLFEKLGGAAPGELRGLAIMHRQTLLVSEAMVGLIAEQLERFASRLHALLEAIDQLRRAPIVPVG